MTAVSKNYYFDVLDNIDNKHNNTVNRIIKIKPIDVTSDSYAECNENSNVTEPKFKNGDHVRISKCKNIFAKGYAQNRSEEFFVVSKVKDTVPWTYVITDLNGEKIAGSFMKMNCKKLGKKNSEQKKYLKEKLVNCITNGKDKIIHLIVGLIKNTFNEIPLNAISLCNNESKLKLIFQIMEQKHISKIFHAVILQVLH